MSKEEFIRKAREIHGWKYDYSKVEYKNMQTKVCIICPEHGEFWQTPHNHINLRHGCIECYRKKQRKTEKEFIEELKKIYGDKYDYSKIKYKNSRTKVCIICPEHGEFYKLPTSLINGYACEYCSKHKLQTKEFVEKAKQIHGDKYDYSLVEYIDSHTEVLVKCPKHGIFKVTPTNHCSKSNKCGCPRCVGKKKTTEQFIEEAKQLHGDKYDYSKVNYINSKTKVCIICPEHGEFWLTPNKHLSGQGCRECEKIKRKFYKLKTTEQFIKEAKEIHGDKYDYSKTVYKGNNEKVCIICPEHGEFWQTPNNHLKYKGCKLCKISHLQLKVKNILNTNKILFEEEKTFSFLKRGKAHYTLDFYLPEHNIAIECQGIQHFEPTNFGGKLTKEEMEENYEKQITNDEIKRKLCEQNNIKVLYYSDIKKKLPKEIIKKESDLIRKIYCE